MERRLEIATEWQTRTAYRWQTDGIKNIFANPYFAEIDECEPFDFDYAHLQNAPETSCPPPTPTSAADRSAHGKNRRQCQLEEILSGEFATRSKDKNFDKGQKAMYGEFESAFMMYLPRLCEHCLNPTCVAACPSGAIYKREEDGMSIDQDKCRGWRMCVSACPYKKIYYNWESGKSEKCVFCYPRIEAGEPTVCLRKLRWAHSLSGRVVV